MNIWRYLQMNVHIFVLFRSAFIEKLQLVNMVCNESTRDELIPAFEANLVYLCQKDGHNKDPMECYGIGKCNSKM